MGRERRGRRSSLERRRVGASRAPARTARGFTLLEILLAIALLGLLSTALVSTATHLLEQRAATPQEVFWEAARTARRTALKREHEVRLSFDPKEKQFILRDGPDVRTFSLPPIADLVVDFLQPQPSGGSVLIGGQLVDTRTISAVSFYPDGTCSPFRIQFRANGPATFVAVDPWTCAPVLAEPKNS